MSGSMVEFASNGQSAQGYLALPESGSGPGVVVIQEWWGLVGHIKDVCERFAGEGFVALAPDLYHGQTTAEPDEAGKLMMELDIERAAKDMAGAARFLAGHEAVTGERVGAVGFCMGGALVLVLAARAGDVVGPTSAFYPAFASGVPDLSGISGPVVLHVASDDDFMPPEKGEALRDQIRDTAGVDVDLQVYAGAGHAFFNDDRPEAHHAEHADAAWRRTLDLLRSNL
jgi:carboxymethylenebutenolidase